MFVDTFLERCGNVPTGYEKIKVTKGQEEIVLTSNQLIVLCGKCTVESWMYHENGEFLFTITIL